MGNLEHNLKPKMSLTKLTTTCAMLALMTPEAHAADNKLTKQLKKNSYKAKSVDITTLSEKLAAQSAIEGPSPSGYTDFHRRRRYYGFSSYGSPYGGGPYDSPYGYGPYDSPYGYGPYDSPYGYDTYGNYYYYLYKRNQGLSMYTMFKNLIPISSSAQLNNAETSSKMAPNAAALPMMKNMSQSARKVPDLMSPHASRTTSAIG